MQGRLVAFDLQNILAVLFKDLTRGFLLGMQRISGDNAFLQIAHFGQCTLGGFDFAAVLFHAQRRHRNGHARGSIGDVERADRFADHLAVHRQTRWQFARTGAAPERECCSQCFEVDEAQQFVIDHVIGRTVQACLGIHGQPQHLSVLLMQRLAIAFDGCDGIWFIARKNLYVKRITRDLVLIQLRIDYLRNIIKFIENHIKYNITNKLSREQVDAVLTTQKYDRFNHTLLARPLYTNLEVLQTIKNGATHCSYDYLVNLKYSELIDDAYKRRKEELAKEEAKLKAAKKDPQGTQTWLNELQILEETIRLGLEKGWTYGHKEPNYK